LHAIDSLTDIMKKESEMSPYDTLPFLLTPSVDVPLYSWLSWWVYHHRAHRTAKKGNVWNRPV